MTREQKIKVQDKNKERTFLQKILHTSKLLGEAFIEARTMSAKEAVRRNVFYY